MIFRFFPLFPMESILNSGDTAFVLAATGLVALMTPGLAFFYGGLVKSKNVLTIMMQSFIAMGVVTVIWSVLTFSLAFGTDVGGWIGGLDHLLMNGVGMEAGAYGASIPYLAFFAFQMMFAIITPALMTGAFTERMNFKAYVAFIALWSVLVYAPLAHWVWGGGFLAKLGAIDFAGGTVVHISAGMGALACVFLLGKRRETAHVAHNIPAAALGTALLWFGWYGFNAGSALAANGQAAIAFVNTHVAAAMCMSTWLLLSTVIDRKASMIGALTGAVAGLVAITPAAGYVTPMSALLIGLAAGLACFSAVKFRTSMGWDDALDVWGCHGVGGITGSILTGVFATESIGGFSGLIEGNTAQFMANLYGTGIAMAFGFGATFVILGAMKLVMTVGVSAAEEEMGLDAVLHGESAYDFETALPAYAIPAVRDAATVTAMSTTLREMAPEYSRA